MNINGLWAKADDLKEEYPKLTNTACMAFVEAKINQNGKAPALHPFKSHSFPFTPVSSGVVVYSAVSCRSLKKYCVTADEGSMITFCQLCVEGLPFVLGVAYLRPGRPAGVTEKILRAIERVLHLDLPLLLLGDFNSRHPQFGDKVKPSSDANKLVSFFTGNNLGIGAGSSCVVGSSSLLHGYR